MNPTFNIQATEIDFNTAQLFVEAGPMGFSLVVLGTDNCFKAVILYPFSSDISEHDLIEKLKTICNSEDLLKKHYHKTHIFWAFTESILVPAALLNADQNQQMLNLVFGDAMQGVVHSDFLYKHNLHNVYRIPKPVNEMLSAALPFATQTHLYSAIVNRDMPDGNHLFSIFYSNSLTIMLCSDAKLQVIQNFDYTHADDCVFHLLNVCKGFNVHPDAVTLHINGMIDQHSGLYDSIYKYFLHIEFDTLSGVYHYDEAIKNNPPHFFSHLFSLAACV